MSILDLAKKINRKGDLFIKNNGIKDFHKKASELLSTSGFEKHFDHDDVVQSVFTAKHSQHFKNLEFSDLPVTLSQGEYCFIDIYFWRRRPTVIHNHHFIGAFMCLLGNNIDFEYTFKKEKKLGRFHDLGKLNLKQTRKILPGNVAEIAFMDKFIHQNHHQAELTVNLCFRTPQEMKKSLSHYLSSGLRFEKNSDLLSRVGCLQKGLEVGILNPDKVKISVDDSLHFLIQTFETRSENPRLLRLRESLENRMENEFGINITQMMREHELMMERLENEYE
jgi:hypothetical protein